MAATGHSIIFQRGEGSDSGKVGELIGWSKVDPPETRQRNVNFSALAHLFRDALSDGS